MGLLSNLKNVVGGALGDGESFLDPAIKEDPVAQETGWGPAKSGGTNIGSHALKEISPERVEFKAKLFALVFPGIFMAAGVFIIVATIQEGLKKGDATLYVGPIIGLIFFLAGFFIARSWMAPRVFDKRKGLYWRGRKEPVRGLQQEDKKKRTHCDLDEIYAVQVIRERCHSSSGSGGSSRTYYSYEINLVLLDGSRINVVDHGKVKRIRSDAQKLAAFLGVPLWDAS